MQTLIDDYLKGDNLAIYIYVEKTNVSVSAMLDYFIYHSGYCPSVHEISKFVNLVDSIKNTISINRGSK